MKKGFISTLGFVLFSLTIFSVSILINDNSIQDEGLREKIMIDDAYNKDAYISFALKNIFNLTEINISFQNNSIIIEEKLGNDNAEKFSYEMNKYKLFVETIGDSITLNISEVNENLPLEIDAYNIRYEHLGFGGKKIRIWPGNMSSYSSYIFSQDNITSINFDPIAAGNFNFHVIAKDDEGSIFESTQNIDLVQNSTLTIETVTGDITIGVKNSRITITNNAQQILVKSIMSVNNTDLAEISYPRNITIIDLGNIKKYGTVKIK